MESSRPDLNAASEHPQSMQHDYDTNSPPNSRLFVVCSKLFSEDDVREIFSPHGSIQDVYIIRDKTSARASKGVCFIKFYKSSEACRAMEELNGKHVRDSERPIKVLMAQSRSSERSYPSGGSQSHGFAGSRGSNFTSEDEQIDNLLRLFVAVDKKQSQEEVKEYFSKFGLVDHVHILKDKETGESRGVAYVKFYRASHAAVALEEASPEYKAILADPRPPKGGPVLNHNSGAPTAPGFHYNSGGASYTAATAAYAPPAPTGVYGGSKGAAGPDSTGVGMQNLLHPNQGYGTLANSGQQPAITPLFPPPPPPHAGAHPHAALGNAPPAHAGLTAMFQMAACGDDGASWFGAAPTNPATAGSLHPQTIPTFEHINMACRTLGFNSCRIQAFVNPSQTTENQIRSIFDLVPGLENFFYGGSTDQQQRGAGGQPKNTSTGSTGIVYATYSTPFAALYAREKLNGLEYPPGCRITAKLLEDTCAYPPAAGTGPLPNRGFGAASNAAAVPTSAQILNMQMTRAMAMGLGGNNLNAGINNMTITTNGPAAIKAASNVSSKAALNSTTQPMPTMGTGDSPQQDAELINTDGVRNYLFPSGGCNPVCVSQESYPSFTSSSSGGSNNANSGGISTHGKSASLPNSGSGEGGQQQPSRNKKRGAGGGANSSAGGGHNRRNSATGVSNKSSNAANAPNAASGVGGASGGVTGTAVTAVVVNQRNFTTSASSQATQAVLPNGMTNGTY